MSIGDLLQGLPGLRISHPRQTSLALHAHVRDLIVTGALPPGTELRQAELARIFGVSRTPLREAFRMLQEEGLVSADPNRCSRVIGFDADELELLYAGRVTLESLGVRLSTGRLTHAEERDAASALREMDRAYRARDQSSWSSAHHHFHLLVVARCGGAVRRTIGSYAERSERYVRAYQSHHRDLFTQRHSEHAAILAAVKADDPDGSAALMARHLAETALRLLGDFAPGRVATDVRTAVEHVAGPDAAASLAP